MIVADYKEYFGLFLRSRSCSGHVYFDLAMLLLCLLRTEPNGA